MQISQTILPYLPCQKTIIPTDHIHRISIHNRELTAYSDFGTFTLRRRGLSNDQDDKKWDDDLEFKWIDTKIH